jgi:hypothetical protein
MSAKRANEPDAERAGKRPRPDCEGGLEATNVLPRITDERKLTQRQKQIEFGKNTISYARFSKAVRKRDRSFKDPWTPDISMPDSKRCFDGKVKEWRRRLHRWEADNPEPTAFSLPEASAAASTAALSTAAAPAAAASDLPVDPAPPGTTRADLEAEADALLAGSGETAVGMDIDAYLDGSLDDDDDSADETHAVPLGVAPATRPLVFGRDAGTPAAPSTSKTFVTRDPSRASSLEHAHALPRPSSIFGDAAGVDDGLVG